MLNFIPKFETRGLRKIMRLLIVVLLTVNVYAQSIPIGPRYDVKNIVIDSLNNELKIFFNDHYNVIDLGTLKSKTHKLQLEDGFNFAERPLVVDSLVYFISNSGGMVYVLKNDTIKRIDKSFNHKMQINAALFAYNSKIYKYGGYGFWSARNFFTYFDHFRNEWEVVAPINSKSIPEGTENLSFILSNDEIYIYGGGKVNPYNRLEQLSNDEVWKFNLGTNEWTYLGKDTYIQTNFLMGLSTGSLNIDTKIRYKNKIIITRPTNIAEIDIVNNKFTIYDHNYPGNSVSGQLILQYNSFYLNNKFYCFYYDQNNSALKQVVKMVVIDEEDFFGEKISESVFYKNKFTHGANTLIGSVTVSFMIAFVLFVLDYRKKKNKVRLLKNGLSFNNKFIEFSHHSMEIIRLLLNKKEVSSNEILSIVESASYSAAHNERIKIQNLKDINLKVKTLIGAKEDVIKSIMSKKDKRIRMYSISKELFFIKKA